MPDGPVLAPLSEPATLEDAPSQMRLRISHADRPPGGRLAAALASTLLLGACSGPAAPDASPSPAAAASPASPAEAHLARGIEAREGLDFSRARDELERALALFEREGNWERHVHARNLLAVVAARRGDYEAALQHANAALAKARERLPPGHVEVSRSCREIGVVFCTTGRTAEGLEMLAKALAGRRTAGRDAKEEADILLRMAFGRSDLGEDDASLALLDEAEAILAGAPGDHGRELANVLIGKGAALWGQGRFDAAIAAADRAVGMLEGKADARAAASLAAAYLNLGNAYWSKSDYDEALAIYGKAMATHIALKGEAHPDVGTAYLNRAVLHLARAGPGDLDAAIADGERAIGILVPVYGERHDSVVQTLNVVGSALTKKGDAGRALAVLRKARALQDALPERNARSSAVIYSSLADAWRLQGDLDEAARNHHRAAAVDRAIFGDHHPDLAEDLVNLGELSLQRGRAREALAWFARAIAANSPPPTRIEPDLDPPFDTAFSEDLLLKALQGSARARAAAGRPSPRDLETAAVAYANAARLTERMRAGYRAEGSKLSLAARATETFDGAIRTELRLFALTGDGRHRDEAYRYAERSKAGVLRDALNEAEARSFAGIPDALLEEERQLRLDLTAVDHRLSDAQEAAADEKRLLDLREERFSLSRRYEALRSRLEKEFPDYYDLKYRFDVAGPAEVRAATLDARTTLVEYFLGREEVFVFTLTARDLEVARVPRAPALETDLGELRRAVVARDEGGYARSAERLYRVLLAPVEARLEGKDLVIVPDGPLHLLPFEALLERGAASPGEAAAPPYVVRTHAVSYAYSATLLVRAAQRKRESPRDAFVAFAPDFAADAAAGAAPAPLAGARREAAQVHALFRRRAGLFGGFFRERSRIYSGPAATKARLRSAGLDRYRYVHFATHGVVDEDHPARSRLLLQPDGRSGSDSDSALTLGDIYNLQLNADLVVLSACDTGGGRLAGGEGIIGLARGFLFAGARSLLVSLWPVSDEATAPLVVDFYEEMLRGRSKAEALREAKLRAMARNPALAKPFYWSAFVLVGERR